MGGMKTSPAPDRYAAVRKIQTPLGHALGARVESYAHIQPPTARVGGYPRERTVSGRWFRTRLPDGSLWAETSDPEDRHLRHPEHQLMLESLGPDGWTDVRELPPADGDHDCGPSCPTPCPSDDEDPRGWQG